MTRLADAKVCVRCQKCAVVSGDICYRCRLNPDAVAAAMKPPVKKTPREGRVSSPTRPSRGHASRAGGMARVGDVAAGFLQALTRRATAGVGVPTPVESPWTLARLGSPAVAFVAFTGGANPAPQGSKSPKGLTSTGRVRMVESSKNVKPWREAIAAAIAACGGNMRMQGPVVLDVVFTIARPQDRARDVHARPDRRPDLDKQLRAVSDALTQGGLWVEDSQLVAYRRAEAMYTGTPDVDCLPEPGVVVRAWPLNAVQER